MSYISLLDIDDNTLNKIIDMLWEISIRKYECDLKNSIIEKEEYEYFLRKPDHCKKVWQIAEKIYCDYSDENLNNNRALLKCACLIHDIKKPDENHGKSGSCFFNEQINKVLSEVFGKEIRLENSEREAVRDLIRFHNKKQDSELSDEFSADNLMGFFIMRIADKFSKYPKKDIKNVIEKADAQIENLLKINPLLNRIREEIIHNIMKYICE